MDDLLSEFVAETRELLTALETALVEWEADPGDTSQLNAIFRFFHTVKGNCGFFDLPRLATLSHAAEDALADIRSGKRQAGSQTVSAILAVADRIGQLTDQLDTGGRLEEGDDSDLLHALTASSGEVAPKKAPSGGRNSDGPLRPKRSIRVPVPLLDTMMSDVSDLVLARNELRHRLTIGTDPVEREAAFARMSALVDRLRDATGRIRMQRLDMLFEGLPRMVRDLTTELGKRVRLDLDGGEVELDREVLELVRDPLTHLIRNAIDHGIELPAQRSAAGKDEEGTIAIGARQAGNLIHITIGDDGCGIETGRLIERAVQRGVLATAEAAAMSDEEAVQLVFAPGLSTTEKVSNISGRGVGMDVVRANIEAIGGSVELATTPGAGTIVNLRLPLTLSIVPAMVVESAGHRFAIAQSYIKEVSEASAEDLDRVRAGDRSLVRIGNEQVPAATLASMLELPATPDPDESYTLLIETASRDRFALDVDRVLDTCDLVVRPLAPALAQCRRYVGVSLLEDGSCIMLLDIATMAQAGGLVERGRGFAAPGLHRSAVREEPEAMQYLWLRDHTGAELALPMSILGRIERIELDAIQQCDGNAIVAFEDRTLPLLGRLPDGEWRSDYTNALRITDGRDELLYAVAELCDIVTPERPASNANARMDGHVLISGRPVPLLPADRLVAENGRAMPRDDQPTCHIAISDGWAERVLAPLVTAAGYRLLADPAEASLQIVSSGEASAHAGRVIAIDELGGFDSDGKVAAGADPSAEGGGAAGSGRRVVGRHDRTALIEALRAERRLIDAA